MEQYEVITEQSEDKLNKTYEIQNGEEISGELFFACIRLSNLLAQASIKTNKTKAAQTNLLNEIIIVGNLICGQNWDKGLTNNGLTYENFKSELSKIDFDEAVNNGRVAYNDKSVIDVVKNELLSEYDEYFKAESKKVESAVKRMNGNEVIKAISNFEDLIRSIGDQVKKEIEEISNSRKQYGLLWRDYESETKQNEIKQNRKPPSLLFQQYPIFQKAVRKKLNKEQDVEAKISEIQCNLAGIFEQYKEDRTENLKIEEGRSCLIAERKKEIRTNYNKAHKDSHTVIIKNNDRLIELSSANKSIISEVVKKLNSVNQYLNDLRLTNSTFKSKKVEEKPANLPEEPNKNLKDALNKVTSTPRTNKSKNDPVTPVGNVSPFSSMKSTSKVRFVSNSSQRNKSVEVKSPSKKMTSIFRNSAQESENDTVDNDSIMVKKSDLDIFAIGYTTLENENIKLKDQIGELKEENIKVQEQLKTSLNERQKLSDEFVLFQQDVTEKLKKQNELENTNQVLQIQLAETSKALTEKETEILELKKSLDEQNDNLTKLQEQISTDKETNDQLTSANAELQKQMKNLQKEFDSKETELTQLNDKIKGAETQQQSLQQNVDELTKKLQTQEDTIKNLSNENVAIKVANDKASGENETYAATVQKISGENINLKTEFGRVKAENECLKKSIEELETEKSKLEKTFKDANEKLTEANQQLTEQNKGLNEQISKLKQEIDQRLEALRNKNQELQLKTNSLESDAKNNEEKFNTQTQLLKEKETTIKNLEKQLEDVSSQREQVGKELAEAKEQIDALQKNAIATTNEQIKKLQGELESKVSAIKDMSNSLNQLNEGIANYTTENKKLEKENESLSSANNELQNKFDETQEKNKALESQVTDLQSENNDLKQELNLKSKELEKLTEGNKKLNESATERANENKTLKTELEEQKKTIDTNKQKISELEESNRSLSNEVAKMNSTLEKNNEELKQTKEANQTLIAEVDELEKSLTKIREENKYALKKVNEENATLAKSNEQQKEQIQKLEAELDDKAKLENENNNLKKQVQALTRDQSEKESQTQNLTLETKPSLSQSAVSAFSFDQQNVSLSITNNDKIFSQELKHESEPTEVIPQEEPKSEVKLAECLYGFASCCLGAALVVAACVPVVRELVGLAALGIILAKAIGVAFLSVGAFAIGFSFRDKIKNAPARAAIANAEYQRLNQPVTDQQVLA